MPRYGLSQGIFTLFVYILIGAVLITFIAALPPLLIAIGIFAILVAGVLSIMRLFRTISSERPGKGNNAGTFDEYGSRKTTATVIDMKDAPSDHQDKPSGEGK